VTDYLYGISPEPLLALVLLVSCAIAVKMTDWFGIDEVKAASVSFVILLGGYLTYAIMHSYHGR
jgi:hypothetical protein